MYKMKGEKLILIVLGLTLVFSLSFVTGNSFMPKWSHEMTIEEIEVKWDSEDPFYLTMQVSAPTTGHFGIGFSPNGGMTGSDIVIGWVDNQGVPHIKDYHALGTMEPVEDPQQDYELIAGSKAEGRTTILFRRRWETCDTRHDLTIGNDTMRLIWAIFFEDPSTGLKYHGVKNRGTRSIHLRAPPNPSKFPDYGHLVFNHPTIKSWDITMDNIEVNGSTSYMCKIVRFPHVRQKHHLIGIRPLIQEENKSQLHHITIIACHVPEYLGGTHRLFEKYLSNSPGDCYSPSIPFEVVKNCFNIIYSWTVGSEGEMFPSHVGIPIGELNGEGTYFRLEIHYDNPEQRKFHDSSGLRIFYTSELRENDAGAIFLGHRVSPFQMIPPGQESYLTRGFCSSDCTKNGLPEEGINVLSGILHAHLIGKKISLRHVRNGKELHPLFKENNYDFNYQIFRRLEKEIKILPGDELIVECDYDSTRKSNMTFGGFSTKEEMCEAFIYYYPKAELLDCRSQPEFESFFRNIGIEEVEGHVLQLMNLPHNDLQLSDGYTPSDNTISLNVGTNNKMERENPFDYLTISKPLEYHNLSFGQYLRELDWSDQRVAKHFEEMSKNGPHYVFCSSLGNRAIPTNKSIVTFSPRFVEYKEPLQALYECRQQESTAAPIPTDFSSFEAPSVTSSFRTSLYVHLTSLLFIAFIWFIYDIDLAIDGY